MEPPQPAPDFTLTDQYGRSFQLSEQQGRVVLLLFGYTHCPDVCPTTLARWKQVYDALGPDAGRVRFVMITVDPERDTPERMQEWLATFNSDFIGLTGTPDELASVYQSYFVYSEKASETESAGGHSYGVQHTGTVFVIDTDGRWRLSQSATMPPDDIVHDIQALLR